MDLAETITILVTGELPVRMTHSFIDITSFYCK